VDLEIHWLEEGPAIQILRTPMSLLPMFRAICSVWAFAGASLEADFGMREGTPITLVDANVTGEQDAAVRIHIALFVLGEDIWMEQRDSVLKQLAAAIYGIRSVSKQQLAFHLVVSTKEEQRNGQELQKLVPLDTHLEVHQLESALKNVTNYASKDDMKRVLKFYGSKKIGEPPNEGESGRDLSNRMMVQKIFAPIVLPNSVADVVLVDTDMLWLQDIARIWEARDGFTKDQLLGMACEPDACRKVPKGFNTKRAKGFAGFNGGMQLMRLGRMRATGSWWLSDEFMATVKSGLYKMGATCDQDLYDWLYASRTSLFKVLPRSFNLQLCGYCPKIMESAPNVTENLFLHKNLSMVQDIVVLHGNCDNEEPGEAGPIKFLWKQLMYATATSLQQMKLRIGPWAGGGRAVLNEDGTTNRKWWPSDVLPSCKKFSSHGRGALGKWDRGVCRLFSAAFAAPPFPAAGG
jgi:hypothetical protein